MKLIKAMFLMLICLFVWQCATPQPVINSFTAEPTKINKGESTTIQWNIKDAESVSITGIGDNLKPIGSERVKPESTTTYNLTAKNGDKMISKELTINVIQPPPPKVASKTIPAVERINNKESVYQEGVINFENVNEKSSLSFRINNVDIADYPNKIKLFVSVVDRYGNFVANLAPPYNNEMNDAWKSLVENWNGKDFKVNNFDVKEVREDVAPPFTTTFVMDYSGSMENEISKVENALKKASDFIRPGKDNFEIIQFDHRTVQSVPLTGNSGEVLKLVPFNQLGRATAFYNSSVTGIWDIKSSNKTKIAILFTDGYDNASFQNNANDVIKQARETDTRVFVIGYGMAQKYILQAIAEQTGGKAYFPTNLSELENIFSDIYQMMKVYYVISYSTEKNDVNIRSVKLEFQPSPSSNMMTASAKYYVLPEQVNEKRIFSVAWFEYGKSNIDNSFMPLIQQIADDLKAKPEKKIMITGHTDTKGGDGINITISKKRANELKKLFISLGVKSKQLKNVDGKGKKMPIYPDDQNDSWKMQENRRVEIEYV